MTNDKFACPGAKDGTNQMGATDGPLFLTYASLMLGCLGFEGALFVLG